MFTHKQSILYFIIGCIPVRFLLVALANYLPVKYLPYLGAVLLIPAIGFLYLYFSNTRLRANEAGGKTWWASLRLVHGVLYLSAAIYALQRKDMVWVPLLIDVLFGLSAFLVHHYGHL